MVKFNTARQQIQRLLLKQKLPDRVKQMLIYIAWGFLAMLLIMALMLVAALIGWGI